MARASWMVVLLLAACASGGPVPSTGAILTYEHEGTGVVEVVRDRLGGLEVEGLTARPAGEGRFEVDVPVTALGDLERIKRMVTVPGRLRFLVVAREQDPAIIARILDGGPGGEYDVAAYPDDPDRHILLETEGMMSGHLLKEAHPTLDPLQRPAVGFTWGSKGARRFGDLTERCIDRRLAIVLDGKLQSSPVIQERIGASGIITGDFTPQEAKDLALVLEGGELPHVPTLVGEKILDKAKEETKE